MKFLTSLVCVLGLLCFSQATIARDKIHHFDFQSVVKESIAEGKLDGSVKFYLAGNGSNYKAFERGLVTNKKTNSFNKSDEHACKIALQSALIQFEKTAKQRKAKAVTNIVSYYKKNTYSSKTRYECHAGGLMSGVALKGDLAR